MSYQVLVDVSPRSAVVVCSCGARDVGTARRVVLLAGAYHLEVAHGDDPATPALVRDLRLRASRLRDTPAR